MVLLDSELPGALLSLLTRSEDSLWKGGKYKHEIITFGQALDSGESSIPTLEVVLDEAADIRSVD